MKKHKKAFSIIESLIYIFMTMVILSEGLKLSIIIYKAYRENAEIVKEYNDIQNFYIAFQNIIDERNVGNVTCSEKEIKFSKFIDGVVKNKSITYKSSDKSIVVNTYDELERFLSANKMIGNISDMKVVKKDNLIYLIIYDKYGKEFISYI